MPDLSIGEVARRAGVRTSAIRYYEKVGLLPRAPRVSRQRRYEPQILDRLAVVRFAQFVGLRLSEIKWLLNDVPGRPPPERWRQLARQRLAQLDALMVEVGAIRELLQMTLDHKCPKLVEQGSRLPEGRRHVARYAMVADAIGRTIDGPALRAPRR
jgi:MerR family redox-sensitive transcriptional activator SoxR